MIRQNELMNVRCSERGSLLGIKIYSPSSECLIECVDIPEHSGPSSRILVSVSRVPGFKHPWCKRALLLLFLSTKAPDWLFCNIVSKCSSIHMELTSFSKYFFSSGWFSFVRAICLRQSHSEVWLLISTVKSEMIPRPAHQVLVWWAKLYKKSSW